MNHTEEKDGARLFSFALVFWQTHATTVHRQPWQTSGNRGIGHPERHTKVSVTTSGKKHRSRAVQTRWLHTTPPSLQNENKAHRKRWWRYWAFTVNGAALSKTNLIKKGGGGEGGVHITELRSHMIGTIPNVPNIKHGATNDALLHENKQKHCTCNTFVQSPAIQLQVTRIHTYPVLWLPQNMALMAATLYPCHDSVHCNIPSI